MAHSGASRPALIQGDVVHYAAGPIVAVVVVVLLGLFTRWAFGTGRGRRVRRSAADDGLLTRIATLSRRESALALRAVLSDAGIRSTLRDQAADRFVVLVFPEDAAEARALAAAFPGPPAPPAGPE